MDPWLATGSWLRCALHAHTTGSDGELTPEALVHHYAQRGFDLLAITDHWRRTDAAANGLLVLPSVELNCVLPGSRDGHVLAFGVRAEPDELVELAGEYGDLSHTADWIEAHGGVAYLAHPYWTGVIPGTLELPENVAGIEVFNAGCELEVGRGLAAVHWDELLESGRLCPAIATDDSHHPAFDSGHAWTWLRAEERSAEAVLAALRAGTFYSSCGPQLRDVRRGEDAIDVICSPVRSVTLVCGRSTGSAVHAGATGYRHRGLVLEENGDGLIVHARLALPAEARHGRVEVTDSAGRKAWANPFPV
jgi:hypothetical protein